MIHLTKFSEKLGIRRGGGCLFVGGDVGFDIVVVVVVVDGVGCGFGYYIPSRILRVGPVNGVDQTGG